MQEKCIAPNTTLHDLMIIYETAFNEAKPGDEYAGNPSLWPLTRGVKAVANHLVELYETELDNQAYSLNEERR